MLHNHLRNFTSHKFLVDFDSPDQADYGSDGVDQFRGRVEIGGYHLGGFVDSGHAVTLGKSSGCERRKQQGDTHRFSCFHTIGFQVYNSIHWYPPWKKEDGEPFGIR